MQHQAGTVEFALAAPDYLKASEKGLGDTVVSPTTGTIEEACRSGSVCTWLLHCR